MDCVCEIIEGEASHKEIKVLFVVFFFFFLFLPLTSGIEKATVTGYLKNTTNQPYPKQTKSFTGELMQRKLCNSQSKT